MSYWNYRVVYHPPSVTKMGKKEIPRDNYLAIHEAYYNENNEVDAITTNSIILGDEGDKTIESLKLILKHMNEALEKPILNNEPENNIFKEINQTNKEKQNEFSKSIKSKKKNDSENSSASD